MRSINAREEHHLRLFQERNSEGTITLVLK